MTKLPETMGFELTNLQKLSVNSNKLVFLPYSTSHMTSLRVLDVRLNCLCSLPNNLENLVRLESLNVSQNFHYLRSLPYSIGLLVSLVDLDVSYNHISTLPDSIGCLTKLRRLHAEGNPLVCPPLDVVEDGVEAIQDYLSAQMLGTEDATTKKSWLRKLVKCGTFNGRPASVDAKGENDGYLLSDYRPIGRLASDYRPIGGLASPRISGVFTPRRFLTPLRSPLRKY